MRECRAVLQPKDLCRLLGQSAIWQFAASRLFTELGQTILQSAEIPLVFATGPLTCSTILELRHTLLDPSSTVHRS